MERQKPKIYLELDAFELGQILALLPYSSYARMDRGLREKIKRAKETIEGEREEEVQPADAPLVEPEIEPAPPDDEFDDIGEVIA